MGKAARLKRERRLAAPPPVGKQRPLAERTQLIWAATGGLLVVVGIVVGVLLATRSTSTPPPAAAPSAADRNAPAALVKAADAVGFHPTTEPGVGQLEDQPASAAQPPSNPNLLPVGAKAPAFTLETPEGRSVSLSAFRGKAVLLEFFATWCPHCNAEAPHLRSLYAALPKSRYAFLSVNADGEDAASVFAYHRYFGLQFPALLDPSSRPGSFHDPGAAGPVSTRYRVQSFPTFYVLDPGGRISWRSDGEQPDALLRKELAKAAARG
jgi:peroxiredoxin